jgi:hypothetical protein
VKLAGFVTPVEFSHKGGHGLCRKYTMPYEKKVWRRGVTKGDDRS